MSAVVERASWKPAADRSTDFGCDEELWGGSVAFAAYCDRDDDHLWNSCVI